MKQYTVLGITMVLLATSAWGQQIHDPTTLVPTPTSDFQNPYQYTPPQPSFVPNPPWSANVRADADSCNMSCLDGCLSVTGQGKVVVAYNWVPVNQPNQWPWRICNTTNAGATWTGQTISASPPYNFDDVSGGNKKDSAICLVMRQVTGGYNYAFVLSTNSGVSWGSIQMIPPAGTGTGVDHPIMMTRYPNILVQFYNNSGNGYQSIARSTNWGTTWNSSMIYVSNATGQTGGPAFAPAPSTYAYSVWGQPAAWMPTSAWFNRSTDLGATWGTPTQLLALSMSSHLPSRRCTHTMPCMAVAPNGTIYVAVMNMMQGTGWDIAVIKSTNQGTTWSAPVRVNDDVATPNADQFCEWITVDRFNQPHVFWLDNRNYYSTNIYGTDVYYSYSTDGGTTWRPNERINDVSPIASVTGDFDRMGDYQQIDCDSSRVYVEWTHPNAQHTAAVPMTAVRLLPSGVEEKPTGNPWVNQRMDFVLAPNRPNPVVSGTELAFELENPSQTTLRIYDLTGKMVRTILEGDLSAGRHTARWDARDASGKPVASGVYYYRLEAGGLTTTKQLVVAR